MQILELILVAIGLSMDALAVSICKGLSVSRVQPKHALAVGLYFGGFQALMPLIGYLLGIRFQTLISAFDHWIAFILLALIGVSPEATTRTHRWTLLSARVPCCRLRWQPASMRWPSA